MHVGGERSPRLFGTSHELCQLVTGDEGDHAIRGWDLDWRQLDAGPLSAKLLQIESEKALFTQVGFSRQFLQRAGCPAGVRTFGLLGEEVTELRWCGHRPVDSDLLVFPQSDYESVSQPGFRGNTLSFTEEYLAGLAEMLGYPQVIESVVKPGSVLTCGADEIAALRNRLRGLVRTVLAEPDSASCAAVRYELEFEIPTALLRAIASAESNREPAPASGRSQAMRRALVFIDENRQEPLRVRDLCGIAGVSWRTLDYAFRELLGVTPKRYLQTLRLDGVRRSLRDAPCGTKVADIANQWGFCHLGKFAADYRQQFGELPLATMRRGTSEYSRPSA